MLQIKCSLLICSLKAINLEEKLVVDINTDGTIWHKIPENLSCTEKASDPRLFGTKSDE